MSHLVKANGYKYVYSTKDSSELKNLLPNFLENEGPAFLELKVKPGSRINLGRPTLRPIDNKKVFMNYLKR
jgi:phosphonopyruvate decarboxylase